MTTPIVHVDAFTDTPFRGNPAAVCLLEAPADAEWMQRVASEMNLSETAFLWPEGPGYRLRWFTPVAEVKLCGHATLASAHHLWESGAASGSTIVFVTLSGELRASRAGDAMALDFPALPVEASAAPEGLVDALGCTPTFVGRARFDYLVELPSEAAVRELRPDIGALRSVEARGVIVTARSQDSRFDIVSRFFAPAVGVPEDPVTGSAHCALAPYWSAKLDTSELRAFQASARGGELGLRCDGERVVLIGKAVTTLRGQLLV